MGRWLILAGSLLLLLGLVLQFAPWLVSWFGKLPGDLHVETERTRLYIPFTSMIILSLAVTVLLNLARLFKHWL